MSAEKSVHLRARKDGENCGKRYARKHGKSIYAQTCYEAETDRLLREYCHHHFGGFSSVPRSIKDEWVRGFDMGWLEYAGPVEIPDG